jgi:hypothetical protein
VHWVRGATIVFAVSLLAFVVGAVVEGFWGAGVSGPGTNWVDQTFGFLEFAGAVVAVLAGLFLAAAALVVGTPRAARRLRHR